MSVAMMGGGGGGSKIMRKTLGKLRTYQFQGPTTATFNVSDLPGYKDFTTNNFALDPVVFEGKDAWTKFTYSFSYNPSSGDLTIKNTVNTDADGGYHHCIGDVSVVCYYID
nr:MAG TPA: hypothetical protein [Caudoviricetes sp.]